MLRGVYPEQTEILRFAQNDRERRAQHDKPSILAVADLRKYGQGMNVYRVGQVTSYVREALELDLFLADLWVSGEVSNLFQSSTGHLYFTLKDAEGQIRCVLFRTSAPLTPLQNGAAVLAHGRISFYEVRGDLQFYVDLVQPEGVGVLHLAFEQLRAKLEAEGLFGLARKRPLPRFPRRIGVVTSPAGAVLHDIITVIGRRYPLVELVVAPTPVQGEEAPDGILAAFQSLNQREDIDLVILARGGGSLEELWAFNEERVARAIYGSRAPVISGVGHETDVTIADLVADVRAPTPSAAAEQAVPDAWELRTTIAGQQRSLQAAVADHLAAHRERVATLAGLLEARRPRVEHHRQRTDDLAQRMALLMGGLLSWQRQRIEGYANRLEALHPQHTLARGYALVHRLPSEELVSRTKQVRSGDQIQVQVSDGAFRGTVDGAGPAAPKKRRGRDQEQLALFP